MERIRYTDIFAGLAQPLELFDLKPSHTLKERQYFAGDLVTHPKHSVLKSSSGGFIRLYLYIALLYNGSSSSITRTTSVSATEALKTQHISVFSDSSPNDIKFVTLPLKKNELQIPLLGDILI